MCTLTWLFDDDGSYSVLFNRDELKTRKRAIPPQLIQDEDASYIAPIDADAGGTWLAVNQFGLTVCLLNNYQTIEPSVNTILSRGKVVSALAACVDITMLNEILAEMDLSCYKGFELVAFHNTVKRWRWDTLTLEELEAYQPITSSSYDSDRVKKTRSEYFKHLKNRDQLNTLKHFHSCHLDDDLKEIDGVPIAANSVCMHRSYAETVSQCLVQVNADQVNMTYTDGAPCSVLPGKPITLHRLAVA